VFYLVGLLCNIISRIQSCGKTILSTLAHIPESDMKEILMLKDRLAMLESKDKCKESFMEYVRYIWDGFIEGEHHRLIADKLTEVAEGKCKRLIVNMPPQAYQVRIRLCTLPIVDYGAKT